MRVIISMEGCCGKEQQPLMIEDVVPNNDNNSNNNGGSNGYRDTFIALNDLLTTLTSASRQYDSWVQEMNNQITIMKKWGDAVADKDRDTPTQNKPTNIDLAALTSGKLREQFVLHVEAIQMAHTELVSNYLKVIAYEFKDLPNHIQRVSRVPGLDVSNRIRSAYGMSSSDVNNSIHYTAKYPSLSGKTLICTTTKSTHGVRPVEIRYEDADPITPEKVTELNRQQAVTEVKAILDMLAETVANISIRDLWSIITVHVANLIKKLKVISEAATTPADAAKTIQISVMNLAGVLTTETLDITWKGVLTDCRGEIAAIMEAIDNFQGEVIEEAPKPTEDAPSEAPSEEPAEDDASEEDTGDDFGDDEAMDEPTEEEDADVAPEEEDKP